MLVFAFRWMPPSPLRILHCFLWVGLVGVGARHTQRRLALLARRNVGRLDVLCQKLHLDEKLAAMGAGSSHMRQIRDAVARLRREDDKPSEPAAAGSAAILPRRMRLTNPSLS